jgi:Phage tail tube protein
MGVSSSIGWIALAKQTAKGSLASAPTVKLKLRACSLEPVKVRARYETTDVGRDPGPAYTSRLGGAGGFQAYAEPTALALLMYLLLGSNADTGTTPNYTHTITPANDLPYCTIWKHVAGNITEKYGDAKLGSGALDGTAGNPFELDIGGIEALSVTFGDTGADALAALEPAGLLFPEMFGEFKIDTVAQTIHQLHFAVNNNTSPHQADNFFPSEIDVGKRTVEFGCTTRYSSPTGAFPGYRREFYGGDAGTVLVPTVISHAAQFLIARNANLSLQVNLPQLTAVPSVPQPDPGGDPLETSWVAEVEKPTASPIVTVVARDQAATV